MCVCVCVCACVCVCVCTIQVLISNTELTLDTASHSIALSNNNFTHLATMGGLMNLPQAVINSVLKFISTLLGYVLM